MRAYRNALLCLAAVAALAFAADTALAQKVFSRGPAKNVAVKGPVRGATPKFTARGPSRGGFRGGRNFGGGFRGPGLGVVVPGVLGVIPPDRGQFVDDSGNGPQGPNRPQQSARRNTGNVPPANERRYVPDEVVLEIPNTVSPAQIDALQTRFRLTRLGSQRFQLTGTTLYRWRIPNNVSVPRAVQALGGDARVASVQPNYLFTIQQSEPTAAREGDAAQYELAKLHLPQAHALAKGDKILVAVIDSGIDADHPELAGAIAESYDTLEQPFTPHKHGTAIAGLIAAHGKLMGAAPGARILAIRAFDPAVQDNGAMTTSILKGIYWATENGARVINMSFAGPRDPELQLRLENAHKNNVVLVAASGNNGPKAAPQYPAAYADVIAVGGTDADDKLFELSVRGSHIAVAAPAEKILIAIPDGGYAPSSGTSYSAAEVSGIVALLLARNPRLTPDQV